MSQCFLLLGTNIGDKKHNLLQASELIFQHVGEILLKSSVYQTAAWGKENQEDFLNQVLKVDTNLAPEQVLTQCLDIEKQLGRIRFEKWGERLIDIDILYYDRLEVDSEQLHLPHPEIQNRRFTLVPLHEIAPDYVHPRLKKTTTALLAKCPDPLEVIKIESNLQKAKEL